MFGLSFTTAPPAGDKSNRTWENLKSTKINKPCMLSGSSQTSGSSTLNGVAGDARWHEIHKSMRKGIKAHEYSPALLSWTVVMLVAGSVAGLTPFHISQDGLGCRPLASIARTLAMRSCVGVRREKQNKTWSVSWVWKVKRKKKKKNTIVKILKWKK